jgi:type II secretory pathway predicted ATPase ExeA
MIKMTTDKLLALYGLKHNPFSRNIPIDSLWNPPGCDAFFFRVENIVMDGGFALLAGEQGLGKSKILQRLSERLLRIGGDIVVGVMERPQSTVSDFYRELGDLFGLNLSPANRYGGFKALRERWRQHIQATLFRPVLLVDEAQEMKLHCLTELRLLGSARFDSNCLLTTILSGGSRLPERLHSKELAPLDSRIRTRWLIQPWKKNDLKSFLEHALQHAGAPDLLTEGLCNTLVEHSAGNLRLLCNMGDELLNIAGERNLKQLNEDLYMDVYARPMSATARSTTSRRKAK